MKFSLAARLHESLLLGNDKRQVLSSIDNYKDALELYHLFCPQRKIITKGDLHNLAAEEFGVFVDVIADVVGERETWRVLALESNVSGSRDWKVSEAIQHAESLKDGAIGLLEITSLLDEIEARLFWRFIIGEKVMRETAFLNAVSQNTSIQSRILKQHIAVKDPEEILEALFNDPESLGAGVLWSEEPSLALTPRRFIPHLSQNGPTKIKKYNGGFYQRILAKGATNMLHITNEPTGSRFVWRDRTGRLIPKGLAPKLDWSIKGPVILEALGENNTIHVYDAIYPRYPTLTLQERLEKFQSSLTDEPIVVHFPTEIEHWSGLVTVLDDEEIIRFPNFSAYEPFSEGGYTLMTSMARKIFRLQQVKLNEGRLFIRVAALDGLDDYVIVGEMEAFDDLTPQLLFSIKRRTGFIPKDTWENVSDTDCIAVEVVTPRITYEPINIESPLLVAVRDDLGISDITQIVDLMFGDDE